MVSQCYKWLNSERHWQSNGAIGVTPNAPHIYRNDSHCDYSADPRVVQLRFIGRVAQLVTCLVTDAKLTADPGVASSIPARSHTFVEIDHEILSTVILLPSAESFMKGCCQLQAKVCARLLVNCLFKLAQEKKCG